MQAWLIVLLLTVASGLAVLPRWWSASPPKPALLWLHGAGGVLALLGLLLLFERDWPQASARIGLVVLTVVTGLVLFSNRIKAQRFPRPVLTLHGLAALLVLGLLLA